MDIKKYSLPIKLKSRGIDRIVPVDVVLERLATGFKWAEGPIWISHEGALLFSDVSGNVMHRWTLKGGLGIYRKPSGYANGNTLDIMGRLVTCEHANRRVSRTEKNGSITTLASHYEGKRLNSPNDVIVRSDGTIYFTDPPDGLTENWGVPGKKELDFQGVYRISPNGDLKLEVRDFQTPNGLAFSPDERLLFIVDTDHMHVRVFDVHANGTLSNGRVFAELDSTLGSGWPDGMKTDIKGNVYVTGPAGIWVFDSHGKTLGVLQIPETATNINWGGSDLRELYITTATEKFEGSALYRVKLSVPGHVLKH